MDSIYTHPVNGTVHPERRCRDRRGDDERVDQLFDGFDNRIESAGLNGDQFSAGYLTAMRKTFSELVTVLHLENDALHRIVDKLSVKLHAPKEGG